MPFSLSNAPGTFQAHVNRCFSDMLDVFLVIYLDDFLIFSETEEEHIEHVSRVLQRVIDSKLACNLSKCVFHKKNIDFLGYEITPLGVNMCPDRIKVINEWAAPTDLKSLQSFLGFCNFYRGFIPDYSEITIPLTNLTKKDQMWCWDDNEARAFQRLKDQFTSADIVRHFNPALPIQLETDASDYAISGILSQTHVDGIHPVSFFSRKLKSAELNYDTHDKELLAIVESLKGYRHFTQGVSEPFKIITDHENLKYFMTTKVLNRRQVRWSHFLSDFNFVLEHRPGRLNQQADALSRRAQDVLDMGDNTIQNKCLLPPELFLPSNVFAILAAKNPIDSVTRLEDEILEASFKDEYYLKVTEWLNLEPAERTKFPAGSGRLKQTINNMDDGDGSQEGFAVDDRGLLYYQDKLYIPKSQRLTILLSRHDTLMSGHYGVSKTMEYINRDFWWPKMVNEIETYVKSCAVCQRVKPGRHKPIGLLKPLPVPSDRWSSVTMDFITDLPPCKGFDSIMVVVDRFTKMAHFSPCTKTITAQGTAKLYIDRVLRHHGIPESIISDRGTQFKSEFWKEFWTQLNVPTSMSTSYHPETDGQTERVNAGINQYIRTFCAYLQDDWVDLLATCEFAYNNSIHSAIGVTPFYANTGSTLR